MDKERQNKEKCDKNGIERANKTKWIYIIKI